MMLSASTFSAEASPISGMQRAAENTPTEDGGLKWWVANPSVFKTATRRTFSKVSVDLGG
jgi:hypothetical protein